MHVLLTDETNRLPSKDAKFLVYGGLVFPVETISEFDSEIRKIREVAGYKAEDEFKFDTRARPDYVSVEKTTEAKKATIELCKKLRCKFIVHIILHEIIKNQDQDQQILWAADYVIGRFNRYLDIEAKDDGICIVDNLPVDAPYKYLAEKFTKGLVLGSGKQISLNRIKLFATTSIGAGHANSAMDIVLGSFRYCINNPKNVDAAKDMMGSVVSLLWHSRVGDNIQAFDKGLIVRPDMNEIRKEEYKEEYKNLFKHINELVKDLE